jgi:3-dehydroquinate dehydratase
MAELENNSITSSLKSQSKYSSVKSWYIDDRSKKGGYKLDKNSWINVRAKLIRIAQANNPDLTDQELQTPSDFTRLTNFKDKKNVKLKRAMWGFMTLFISTIIAASINENKK